MSAASHRERFERDGYLVLPGSVPAPECDALRARMVELVEAFEPGEVATIFSTTRRSHAQDRYFLELGRPDPLLLRGGGIRREGAAPAEQAALDQQGRPCAARSRPGLRTRFSRRPALAALVRELGLAEPLLLQSMYIFKQPRIGGEVVCHQDAAFLHTEPSSVIGLWFALEDATTLNGCMYAAPGGHRGPLRTRFLRHGERTETITLDPSPLPSRGPRTARGREGRAHRPPRPPAARQRTQSLGPIAPRLYPARHRRAGALQRRQLAAARTGHAAARLLS